MFVFIDALIYRKKHEFWIISPQFASLLSFPVCFNIAACGWGQTEYENTSALCGFVYTGSFFEAHPLTMIIIETTPERYIGLYIIVSLMADNIRSKCDYHHLKVSDQFCSLYLKKMVIKVRRPVGIRGAGHCLGAAHVLRGCVWSPI